MPQDFASKRKALFQCLDDASKETIGTSLDQGDAAMIVLKRNRIDALDQNLSFMRGKESIFKKPERPITKCLKSRQTPDYLTNPHKWKKYSLSDVDISDHTNASAAFDFLRQMDEQRDAGYESQPLDVETPPGPQRKIEFKKLDRMYKKFRVCESVDLADHELDTPKLKGTVLVMPEYVVGQKAPSVRNLSKKGERRSKNQAQLKLTHLEEMQDEADDDDDDDDDDDTGEH